MWDNVQYFTSLYITQGDEIKKKLLNKEYTALYFYFRVKLLDSLDDNMINCYSIVLFFYRTMVQKKLLQSEMDSSSDSFYKYL